MPVNEKYFAPFVPDGFFHVYNRTNGSHKLFRDPNNYEYFLRNALEDLSDALDFYSYCLLPSHFHFIVKVKPANEILQLLRCGSSDNNDINKVVSRQLKNFFIKYTMSFNKYHNRQGSLFNHRFRRVAIESFDQLKDSIFYVHSNPVHHSLSKTFIDYPWISYQLILSNEPTTVKRQEVLELFGGKNEFIDFHKLHKPIIAKPYFS
jgi:REP element-mobilizing transposase RayT